MTTRLYPCLVIPITFRPYAETGEFACFGVLLHCPEQRYTNYRLGERDRRITDRINNFFREIGRDIFKMTIKSAKRDLDQLVNAQSDLFSYKDVDELFKNLIRPRENLIRYGQPMAVMTDNPAAELDRQYSLLVERGFVDHAGHYETAVRERVKRYLAERHIGFRQYPVRAPNNYVFHLPIVFDAKNAKNGKKVVKALNLAGATVTETFDNGMKWHYRFDQLGNAGFGQGDIFVPVNLASTDPAVHAAALEVASDLAPLVSLVDSENPDMEHEALVTFAEDAIPEGQ